MGSAKPARVIHYHDTAEDDLYEIWLYNARQYGLRHANQYSYFLTNSIEELAEDPALGKAVERSPGLFRLTIKARQRGHGYTVFYRIEKDIISVVRVLHTARDWQNHIFQ